MLVTAPRPKMKRTTRMASAARDSRPRPTVNGVTSLPPRGAGAWDAACNGLLMIASFRAVVAMVLDVALGRPGQHPQEGQRRHETAVDRVLHRLRHRGVGMGRQIGITELVEGNAGEHQH